jgi:hypothetical protein
MVQLVITDEQLRILTNASGNVPIVDARGQMVGMATQPHFSADDVAQAKRRLAANEPQYTTAQVLEHLQAGKVPQ